MRGREPSSDGYRHHGNSSNSEEKHENRSRGEVEGACPAGRCPIRLTVAGCASDGYQDEWHERDEHIALVISRVHRIVWFVEDSDGALQPRDREEDSQDKKIGKRFGFLEVAKPPVELLPEKEAHHGRDSDDEKQLRDGELPKRCGSQGEGERERPLGASS